MTFAECVAVCASRPELVAQFDRLTGHHLSTLDARAPLDAMIDDASGRDKAAIEAFIAFVWDCVWTRLPRDLDFPKSDPAIGMEPVL